MTWLSKACMPEYHFPMPNFRDAIRQQKFTLTADLALNRSSTADDVRSQARLLAPAFDAVQVTDNPGGRLQMSALAAAQIVLGEGVDPLVHVCGRDRNRIALESDLLGLGVAGVRSLLLMRGEELPAHYKPPTRHVFELSGLDLITVAKQLGEDESVPAVTGFHIGTTTTVFNPKRDWQPRSLLTRVDGGAHFVQTQLCFNMKALRRYMEHLVGAKITWRCAVIVGIAVLPSALTASWLRDNLKGAMMPEKFIRRMEQALDPEREGVRIAAETLQKLQEVPGISGANLMTPGDPATLVEAVRSAGLRS